MPRYVIERNFPDGLKIPTNEQGARNCQAVVLNNTRRGVTWLHSYVTEDLKKTFCIYDAPDAEAIREVARLNNLPVESITAVRVLDPYFYWS